MLRLRFHDHREFHFQVLRVIFVMAAAATVAGLWGGSPTVVALLAAAVVPALGFSLAPPQADRRASELLLGGLFAVVGAAAALTLTPAPVAPAIGIGLAAGILASRGRDLWRRVAVSAACGASIPLATIVAQNLAAAAPLADLPPAVAHVVAGALSGLTAALGALALQARVERDAVLEAHGALKGALEGEVGAIVEQSLTAYGRIRPALETVAPAERAQLSKAVSDLTLSILNLARRLVAIDREAHATSAEDLARRLDSLDERIARTEDRIAREQYGLARTAVLAQLSYLKDIGAGRERIIARMHHDLAGLERLRLALVNHRSADVQRVSVDVQVILEDLRSLGQEYDLKAEAMGEAQAAIDPADEAPHDPAAPAAG